MLVDLDAFFASVEQLDHPSWRGKPVIVGGDPSKRGVVSTASYEARAYGVHSAMPSSQAARLCPDAIWTPGHFDRYRQVSNQVMQILYDETPHVQQVSIDEAFVDISPTRTNREHPIAVAQRIQRRVEELGVTCSIGLGTTKSIAKIASDMDKPRGLTAVFPGGERAFLDPLPVRAMSGIGQAAQAKLKSRGIETLGQLAAADEGMLVRLLGKNGALMHSRASGGYDPVVEEPAEVKSVSNETSFAEDLTERADIRAAIDTMAAKVGRRLRMKGLAGWTLSLKIRYGDRSVRSVQRRLTEPIDDEYVMQPLLHSMLEELWVPYMSVRLVGVAVTGFTGEQPIQESLFDTDTLDDASKSQQEGVLIADDAKRRGLLEASDLVKNRFGEGALRMGRELRQGNLATGSSAKNPADYK